MTKIEKKSIKVTKEWNTETRRGHLLATERAGDVCLLKVKGKASRLIVAMKPRMSTFTNQVPVKIKANANHFIRRGKNQLSFVFFLCVRPTSTPNHDMPLNFLKSNISLK